jgi:hypothetical protein
MSRDLTDSQGREWRCYQEGGGGVSHGRVADHGADRYAVVRCYFRGLTAMFKAPLTWGEMPDGDLRELLEQKLRELETQGPRS